MKQIVSKGLDDLPDVARQIIAAAWDKKVWVFHGEMGAGKTTLIKAIASAFEIEDIVQSPTFSLVNEYSNKQGATFYHFDFYRIADEEEAMQIGVEEYLDSGHYCWLEWASLIPNLLPDALLMIKISLNQSGHRIIALEHYD